MLNSDLIETVESTPDTVIRLVTGGRLIVREDAQEILGKVVQFRRSVESHPVATSFLASLAPAHGERDG